MIAASSASSEVIMAAKPILEFAADIGQKTTIEGAFSEAKCLIPMSRCWLEEGILSEIDSVVCELWENAVDSLSE